MEQQINKGGRPRSFDREDAVATALRLFRRHGYEGVSLAMLTDAIGIAPPSLYSAFGSKAGLYQAALARYSSGLSVTDLSNDAAAPLGVALERMFDRAVASVCGPPPERGCMISTGLLVCHPDHAGLADDLASRRRAMAKELATELERWLASREAIETARFICAVLQGIAVVAGDGATEDELRAIAAAALAGIPATRLPVQPLQKSNAIALNRDQTPD
jgi:AcrR family transcriptional regulator